MSSTVRGIGAAPARRRRRGRPARTRVRARTRTRPALDLELLLEPLALLEVSCDGVVGVLPDGTIASFNAGAERLFGYARSEVLGEKVTMFCPPERLHEVDQLIDGALAGRPAEPIETERIAKDGRILRLRLAVSPVRAADGRIVGATAVVRDMSRQWQAERELRESEERYRAVVEALNDAIVIVDDTAQVVGFNESAVRLAGSTASELAEASAHEPIVEMIHEDGRPFVPEEMPAVVSLRTGERQSGIVMGLRALDGTVRWVTANSAPLTDDGDRPCGAVVSMTDVTSQRRALRDLKTARLEDLKRLALVSEYRDDETNRHTERVARTAQLLAAQLGMQGMDVWTLGRAAPLHDVGKVGIPDGILLKPGRLSEEEFDIMKTHTSIGGRILGESDFVILRMAMEVALTHHEHWDGAGYPNGLAGEEIPLAGRIVAVADAFDAMTHERPYKAAVNAEQAVAELTRCSGSQFDPRVVEAFTRLDHRALVGRG